MMIKAEFNVCPDYNRCFARRRAVTETNPDDFRCLECDLYRSYSLGFSEGVKQAVNAMNNVQTLELQIGRMTNREVIEQLLAIKKLGCLTDKDRQALNLAIKAVEALEHCTYFGQGACGKCTYYDWQSAMARDYGVRGEEE